MKCDIILQVEIVSLFLECRKRGLVLLTESSYRKLQEIGLILHISHINSPYSTLSYLKIRVQKHNRKVNVSLFLSRPGGSQSVNNILMRSRNSRELKETQSTGSFSQRLHSFSSFLIHKWIQRIHECNIVTKSIKVLRNHILEHSKNLNYLFRVSYEYVNPILKRTQTDLEYNGISKMLDDSHFVELVLEHLSFLPSVHVLLI